MNKVRQDQQSLMTKKNWVCKLKMYMFDLKNRVIQVEKSVDSLLSISSDGVGPFFLVLRTLP